MTTVRETVEGRSWCRGVVWAVAALGLTCTTAPTSPRTFDDLGRALEAAPASAHATLVERYLRGRTTPIVEADAVVFLVQASPGRPPRIVGDFNGWGSVGDDFDEAAGRMSALGASGWYGLRVALSPAARIEYRVAWGPDEQAVDPRNPEIVATGIQASSVVGMPDARRAPGIAALHQPPPERVIALDVPSRVFGRARRVHVYLPPDDGRNLWPTIYVHDGSTFIEDAGLPAILETQIVEHAMAPVIAVFTTPDDREDEYRRNPRHREWLTDDLVPFIDAHYPTRASATERAVLGASRGALAAADVALVRPDVFGLCVALAPGLQPTTIVEDVRHTAASSTRYFVLAGRYDLRWGDHGRRLAAALGEAGFAIEFVDAPVGHSHAAWRPYLFDVLSEFFSMRRARSDTLPRPSAGGAT